MKRKIFLPVLMFSITMSSCFPGKKLEANLNSKPIIARYTGGHYFYISLTLYTDSTFFYIEVPDVYPAFQTWRRGSFTRDRSSITLYGRRRWNSFWKKQPPETFRRRGKDLLMYSEKQEFSEDSSYIKAYYTLSLEK